MNLNILKNDLKRRKSINVILFLFIILASMLMAGSMNVLYTTSTAISRMMKTAHVPVLSLYSYDNPTTNKQIEDWAATSDKVSSFKKDEMLLIMSDAFYSGSKQIVPKEKMSSVLLTAIPKDHSLVFNQDNQPMKLNTGEIAVPMAFHKAYDVNIGDTMSIHVGDGQKEFTVALRDLVNNIQSTYSEKLALIHTDFVVAPFSNLLLKGDQQRLLDVFENLIENAVKYGDGRKISLSFSTEDNCQLIAVENTGTPVSPLESMHVFESFWRGSNAHDKPGNGLGLYICRYICKKMSGDIFITKSDVGMCFTVVVPIA